MKPTPYWVCSEALALGAQLPAAEDLPAPEILQQRLASVLDQVSQRGQQAGYAPSDVAEMRYALCAFLDEQILRSRWPGRQQWLARPLQLVYFNENTAGEGFFTRLDSLVRDPARQHVLEVFYLCLSLGFQGRYAVGNLVGLESVLQAARVALRIPGSDSNLSPNVAAGTGARNGARGWPWISMAVTVLVLAVLLVIAFRVLLLARSTSLVQTLAASVQRPTDVERGGVSCG